MFKQEYTTDENGAEILLREDEHQVMMEWEKPYMEAIINEIKPTGHVLEIGFGCGYSATAIQQYKPKSHTIIECHEVGIKKGLEWAKNYDNIIIREGFWQQQLSKLGYYDFIFFDDFPLSTEYLKENNAHQLKLQNNRFNMFFDICLDWHMDKGSILSAYVGSSESAYKDPIFKRNVIDNPKVEYIEKFTKVEVPINCNYFSGVDFGVIPIIKKIS